MLAIFCLRLALGMIASLPLLFSVPVQPRFYRTHFLTVFALVTLASVFLAAQASWLLWLLLGATLLLSLVGSLAFSIDGSRGGYAWVVLTILSLLGVLVQLRGIDLSQLPDDLTSAALVGTAMTAMLLGHSYLISPTMSLRPLFTLLGAFGVAVLARVALAMLGLWTWTGHLESGRLERELVLLLPVRWVIGFVLPLVLGWMAYETARIRSTQSATGILYVAVVFCFLGELTSQLLLDKTGYVL
jgi:hypothetical protein